MGRISKMFSGELCIKYFGLIGISIFNSLIKAMKKCRLICSIGLMAIALIACRKEADSTSPVISVSEPSPGEVYEVYDTLWISASLSDGSKLVSVKITLLDAEKKPVLNTLDFKPEAATFDIFTGLPLDDVHLVDGTYTLQIKAYDGTNYTNAFIEVQINEVSLDLKYPVIISRNGIYGTNISIAGANGTWSKVLSLEGDYNISDISSYDQQVYIAGRLSGSLSACLLPSGPVVWQVPLVSAPPYREFEDVFFSWPLLYVAYYEGKILGYDRLGMVVYSSIIEPGYFPEKIGKNGDFILALLRQKTGYVRKIGVYYAISGSLMQFLEVPLDVVAFKTIDKDNVLVFGNNGNTGTILKYTISQNKLRQLHDFTDGKIGAVAQMNNSHFFISGSSVVHWFIYPTNTLTEYISDAPKALLDFDVVNDQLYALYNHQLMVFDFPSAMPLGSIAMADSAFAIHLMYNK